MIKVVFHYVFINSASLFDHCIDLWLKILAVLRRQVVVDPSVLYKTNTSFSDFIFAVETVKKEFVKLKYKPLKDILFEGINIIAQKQFSVEIMLNKTLMSATDLRLPQYWYPQTRLKKRRFIYHGGPTNSG